MGWDNGGRRREKRWTKDRCDARETPRVQVRWPNVILTRTSESLRRISLPTTPVDGGNERIGWNI